jgi:hypothetical protein
VKPSETELAGLNVLVAEACGWKVVLLQGVWPNRYHVTAPSGEKYNYVTADFLPNYVGSLDAMHEAENLLTDEQWIHYMGQLSFATELNKYPVGFGEFRPLVSAKAWQRATAFVAVKGGK